MTWQTTGQQNNTRTTTTGRTSGGNERTTELGGKITCPNGRVRHGARTPSPRARTWRPRAAASRTRVARGRTRNGERARASQPRANAVVVRGNGCARPQRATRAARGKPAMAPRGKTMQTELENGAPNVQVAVEGRTTTTGGKVGRGQAGTRGSRCVESTGTNSRHQ